MYHVSSFSVGETGHLSATCVKSSTSSIAKSSNVAGKWLDVETNAEVEYNDFDWNDSCDIDILQYEEFCSRDKNDNVTGRLWGQLAFLRDILDAAEFMLLMIANGYRLPFVQYPPHCNLKNHLSALKHPDFVQEAVAQLLRNHCITERTCPRCVNPLTVGRQKIALGHWSPTLNQHIFKNKFEYEDLRSLSQVIEQGHWFLRGIWSPVTITLTSHLSIKSI